MCLSAGILKAINFDKILFFSYSWKVILYHWWTTKIAICIPQFLLLYFCYCIFNSVRLEGLNWPMGCTNGVKWGEYMYNNRMFKEWEMEALKNEQLKFIIQMYYILLNPSNEILWKETLGKWRFFYNIAIFSDGVVFIWLI